MVEHRDPDPPIVEKEVSKRKSFLLFFLACSHILLASGLSGETYFSFI